MSTFRLTARLLRDTSGMRQFSTKHSHYETLNLRRDATVSEVRKAFISAAKRAHPDVSRANPRAAQEEFVRILVAYETLSNRQKRIEYDRSLHATGPKPAWPQRSSHEGGTSAGGQTWEWQRPPGWTWKPEFQQYQQRPAEPEPPEDTRSLFTQLRDSFQSALETAAAGPAFRGSLSDWPYAFELEIRNAGTVHATDNIVEMVVGRTLLGAVRGRGLTRLSPHDAATASLLQAESSQPATDAGRAGVTGTGRQGDRSGAGTHAPNPAFTVDPRLEGPYGCYDFLELVYQGQVVASAHRHTRQAGTTDGRGTQRTGHATSAQSTETDDGLDDETSSYITIYSHDPASGERGPPLAHILSPVGLGMLNFRRIVACDLVNPSVDQWWREKEREKLARAQAAQQRDAAHTRPETSDAQRTSVDTASGTNTDSGSSPPSTTEAQVVEGPDTANDVVYSRHASAQPAASTRVNEQNEPALSGASRAQAPPAQPAHVAGRDSGTSPSFIPLGMNVALGAASDNMQPLEIDRAAHTGTSIPTTSGAQAPGGPAYGQVGPASGWKDVDPRIRPGGWAGLSAAASYQSEDSLPHLPSVLDERSIRRAEGRELAMARHEVRVRVVQAAMDDLAEGVWRKRTVRLTARNAVPHPVGPDVPRQAIAASSATTVATSTQHTTVDETSGSSIDYTNSPSTSPGGPDDLAELLCSPRLHRLTDPDGGVRVLPRARQILQDREDRRRMAAERAEYGLASGPRVGGGHSEDGGSSWRPSGPEADARPGDAVWNASHWWDRDGFDGTTDVPTFSSEPHTRRTWRDTARGRAFAEATAADGRAGETDAGGHGKHVQHARARGQSPPHDASLAHPSYATHILFSWYTPGVTHLRFLRNVDGVVEASGSRVNLPPPSLWLWKPRSELHTSGNFTFELARRRAVDSALHPSVYVLAAAVMNLEAEVDSYSRGAMVDRALDRAKTAADRLKGSLHKALPQEVHDGLGTDQPWFGQGPAFSFTLGQRQADQGGQATQQPDRPGATGSPK